MIPPMAPNDGSCHDLVTNVTKGKRAMDGTPEPKSSPFIYLEMQIAKSFSLYILFTVIN